MPDPRRVKRLEKVILHTIAPEISHGLRDPRLQFVTVTRIHLSSDLSVARVNWSILGGEADRNKAQRALEDASGRLQGRVGKSMQTRVMPRLEFYYDESLAKAARVAEILGKLAKERDEKKPKEEEG
ncbi:MAG: 30S ribosome-binding factor RbfA [Planctomycetota bacterium]|jgi:ribosome-binding factor A|nr:30S ribosome-binding factor RbfA [Planctomycetota bacterium]